MTRIEMRTGTVLPGTPGSNGLVVKEGQTRGEAYGEQCGHPTDPVEKSREQRAAKNAFKERFPGLGSPFVADRYGGDVKTVGPDLSRQQEGSAESR